MAYVITQRCVNDTSCIAECPVDCIRPTPDQREFSDAEMLYIDPDTCINCGACADACPVDAIHSEDELVTSLRQFREINSGYFRLHPLQPRPPAVQRAAAAVEVVEHPPLRVAIVGSGPAAGYAAAALLASNRTEVDIVEKLPTPGGLIRAGVAPDHQQTKRMADTLQFAPDTPALRCHLNVEVGRHVNHDELLQHFHAVIYAVGAAADRRLDIPGEELEGCIAASEFVGWYNGHPDHADRRFDLSGDRAVIVGNGNVALDIARVLTADPDHLAQTDIADHALAALRQSMIQEVVVLGRRGVADAAYTASEFHALRFLADIDIDVDRRDLAGEVGSLPTSVRAVGNYGLNLKVQLADEYARRRPTPGHKRILFRYLTSPVAILGTHHTVALRVVRNRLVENQGRRTACPTGEFAAIDTKLVLRSVGYRSDPIPAVPFDDSAMIVPNDSGRVRVPGENTPRTYVTGWVKRGPSGYIGTNKQCARETVSTLLTDFLTGRIPEPRSSRDEFHTLLQRRQPDLMDRRDWRLIDSLERDAGTAAARPRVKFCAVDDIISAVKKHHGDLSNP
ncbi:4Fe-4S binding protein [Nocardia asteroides]|uniref:4Fe-4S binding protein n=1 Tax=Nocardia asteroides TaxID=1824 RepID=UPI003414CEF8